jgi:hypothetical protein
LVHAPADALLDAVNCLGAESGFVLVESALKRKVLSTSEFRRFLARCTSGPRLLLGAATPLSGSGLESLFVFRVRRLGISVRQQVQIGADRVDVVIGDRIVVELDSREFHEPDADSRRDARLLALGYRVIRFRYRQIMFDWPSVEAAVLGAL